ncbi:transmembrane protein, putative (macronuclear) [Tetrahymena thermophila SB210]|uniref:Transmembrane protein, putative n=1 Tax=Tetrahymena thermophila (strain SB210) TaxID=312017 RepID=W7X1Q3_TETTS|nr:transmembrane protein, putative [Tetrahymena thermophila SB210]EWS71552.1 transmembrane protein, putative [Tetrahymena thermophila SB210]|eukprot:XP_012655914.1 transmembrane protein, putative [Tetrahymena thermophila SB210]
MGVKEYLLILVQIVLIDVFLINAIMIIMVKIHFYPVNKILKEKGILKYAQDLYIHTAETNQRVMKIIYVYIEISQKNKQINKIFKCKLYFETHFIFAQQDILIELQISNLFRIIYKQTIKQHVYKSKNKIIIFGYPSIFILFVIFVWILKFLQYIQTLFTNEISCSEHKKCQR